jgi:mannose-1-phosphate guanylyltransferase
VAIALGYAAMLIPVILSGGSGTRLWPLSREHSPKQFLSLAGDRSLFQQALERASMISDSLPIIVCNEEHRFMAAEQLRQAGQRATILLEPIGRNTAPAIALAAFQALVDSRLRGNDKASGNDKESEAPILLVLAADHVIKDIIALQAAVKTLEPAVREGKFGTLGVVPTEPATGYGYIKAGTETSGLYTVEQFVEKPDAETAQSYLDAHCYYWNSGIFMIRADRYLEELKRRQPEMYAACEAAMANTEQDYDFVRIDKEAFIASPDDSIDYALMEPLTAEPLTADSANSQVVVAPLDAGWNDVGSWSALWDLADKCEGGNSVLHTGNAETILKDTCNSLISTSDRLVSTLGVDDLVIVDTKDALLVAHRDRVQEVKGIVAQIKNKGYGHHEFHREVYRPWGHYDAIDRGDKYQVKRISVKPGGKLSLQMHHHRAEHWVVVSGVAEVTRGGSTFLLRENESTFIPVGERHSLRNPGESDLEIIEVQSGAFLSEDDIVRYEDDYGRV